MRYSESTLRRKANNIGYQVEKGYQHFNCKVFRNCNGERYTGYRVKDLSTGFYEWGSYNEHFDHLWDLDDVAKFLADEYEARGLTW